MLLAKYCGVVATMNIVWCQWNGLVLILYELCCKTIWSGVGDEYVVVLMASKLPTWAIKPKRVNLLLLFVSNMLNAKREILNFLFIKGKERSDPGLIRDLLLSNQSLSYQSRVHGARGIVLVTVEESIYDVKFGIVLMSKIYHHDDEKWRVVL